MCMDLTKSHKFVTIAFSYFSALATYGHNVVIHQLQTLHNSTYAHNIQYFIVTKVI